MTETEAGKILAMYENAPAIRRRYKVSWTVFAASMVVMGIAWFLFPEDRHVLHFYVIASVGPLLAQWSLFGQIRGKSIAAPAWVRIILFCTITGSLLVRTFTGGRQELYIAFMLLMGPLLIMSNLFTGLRVREAAQALTEKRKS